MLSDHKWEFKYTPDDGDLVELFYLPALKDARRYDRLTGYFDARALTLAARGIEGLVRNQGTMRLVVGCTLEQAEIEAIQKGEQLRDLVERHLKNYPLNPPDTASSNALELLAWMVARGHLQVKVAVPCDEHGKPIPADGIFHEKAGIIEDGGGNRIAWNGSLNETEAGWQRNWESINVYTSWGAEPGRVDEEEASFERIWAGRTDRVIVLDVPGAVRQDLMRFMPENDWPARLDESGQEPAEKPAPKTTQTRDGEAAGNKPTTPAQDELRSRVWSFIRQAPSLPGGGELVGEVTSAVTPWPHQTRAFERLYRHWPPRLLIADEVGLGKTIQAGMLLRQAWLSGRVKRVLILAPKAVLRQWQIELREKFNLNWPIYDGNKLVWDPSPAWQGQNERKISKESWHQESVVIASSHLMRRRGRATALLEQAEPWDLVVLDEAHHARRRAPGNRKKGVPNALLRLMQGLKQRTEGLVLLTATPMQVHPVEVWDLLHLLGLPPEWTEEGFLGFFENIEQPRPSADEFEHMARLFRSVEECFGKVETGQAQRLVGLSRVKTRKVLRVLRDHAITPRRQLGPTERKAAISIMRAHTPVRRLVSRHTRALLRRYFKAGTITTPIAERLVEDRFVEMTPEERSLYEEVEEYIARTYSRAEADKRTAVGFVMTVYRRRLASSFRALRNTLENRLKGIAAGGARAQEAMNLEEDTPDDEAVDEALDAEEMAKLEREALAAEEKVDIQHLFDLISPLPPDSKLGHLRSALEALRKAGCRQAMVFTQYTDTMDFLREELLKDSDAKLMCFSGRGGEIPSTDGSWSRIGRHDAGRRFRDGEADVLLCTEAAAEGLNFQFCGALINYDMPWNPMRVEQRIGRIDRLGQEHKEIRIVNLHYEDTVETDVYQALRERIDLFESVVGSLQPILARLPARISETLLSGKGRDAGERASLVDTIRQEAEEAGQQGFDINTVTDEDLAMPSRPPSPVTMEDLDRLIRSPHLMPPGTSVKPLGAREYDLQAPGMKERLRVTTDPQYFEAHPESMELWSPGNILFQPPEDLPPAKETPEAGSLRELLED